MNVLSKESVSTAFYSGQDFLVFLEKNPGVKKDVFKLWSTPQKKLQSGSENTYVVLFSDQKKSKIIALAKIVKSLSDSGATFGFVHNVVVDEKYRGLGLGKTLMHNVLQHGREKDYSYLELTSKSFRIPANNLYKTIGFTLISEAKSENDTNHYRYFYS